MALEITLTPTGRGIDEPPAEPRQTSSNAKAAVGAAGERLIDNVLGIPEVIAESFAANPFTDPMTGKPPPRPDFDFSGVLPAGRDVLGGLDVLTGGEPSMAAANETRTQARSDSPLSSMLGDVLGDATTLLSGRGPALRKLPAAPRVMTSDIIKPALRPLLDKAFRSKAAQNLSTIAGRSIEGGLEAATLSVLQDGDPLEQAVLTASSQAFGLGALKLSQVDGLGDLVKGRFVKGGGKLAATAIGVGAIIQVLKDATPGGRDFILESIETGFEKIPLMLAIGTLGALTGAGRVKGVEIPIIKADLPVEIMDAFSTLPRAGLMSLIRDATEKLDEGNDVPERTLKQVLTNAGAFGKQQLETVEESFKEGNFDKIIELYNVDETFRKIIDTPAELLGIPLKDDDEQPKRRGLQGRGVNPRGL